MKLVATSPSAAVLASAYFDSVDVDADADNYESAVTVVIDEHSVEAMELFPEDAIVIEQEYIYFVLMGASALFAMVGVLAFIYQSGKCLKPKVDSSRWAAWFAFALQFWDFVSDITLSYELWTESWSGFDSQELLIHISTIGSTAFVVIPYVSNLWIAANIKKYGRVV